MEGTDNRKCGIEKWNRKGEERGDLELWNVERGVGE